MSDDLRRRILERKARFVAAAMALGATSAIAACEAQVCLEPTVDCDADTKRLQINGPSTVCVGQPVSFGAVRTGYCGSDAVSAVFATSDPELLVLEGSSGRALRPGTVTITALHEGDEAKTTLVIEPCADAGSADANDAD